MKSTVKNNVSGCGQTSLYVVKGYQKDGGGGGGDEGHKSFGHQFGGAITFVAVL